MGRLDGKVAFLTGAGAGIAKATALAYAKEGAKVAIAEINAEAGRTAERQVRAAGGDAIFIETDVTCRHGIPHMIKAGGGSIINLSSHLGLMGSEKPAYSATKGGIVSFTKTLAAQYVDYGIRANAIAPGTVRTERSIKRWENKEQLLADDPTPAMRVRLAKQKMYPFSVGEASDIAAIAVFLAADESRMITGTTIAADGGRSSYLKVYVPEE